MIEGSFLVAGGRRLACRWVGRERRGPALVFLHEGLGSIGQWQDFPAALADTLGLPAFLYERYGHGRSDALAAPRRPSYLHEEALAVLPEVLERAGVSDPILIGHSDGGSIALIYAATHAPRAVVSIAAHVFVEEIGLAGIRRAIAAYRSGELKRRLERYHGDRTDAMFQAWADIWLAPEFRNLRIDLSGLTCPVLVMQGADDEYGSLEQVERIASGVRGPVERVVLGNCGHAPHRQARGEALERVKEFLQRLLRLAQYGDG